MDRCGRFAADDFQVRQAPSPNASPSSVNLGLMDFGRLGRRQVQGCFDDGSMTSDAAVMLLSALDRKLGLTMAPARCF